MCSVLRGKSKVDEVIAFPSACGRYVLGVSGDDDDVGWVFGKRREN
jgi:hypothetical protein